jgi:lysine-ketoglutarate reductase/saccharopine dehydrogenase-like protein (TIGR00300 family)
MLIMPSYIAPDFSSPELAVAPPVRTEPAPTDGILPDGFHATSNHPEYIHLGNGHWLLAREGRMDGVLVLRGENLEVVEPRRVRQGDPVVIGRSENGEEGIYLHTVGFAAATGPADKFSFRGRDSRESSFSRSYDTLYDIMRHDRHHGSIVWVAGPALTFDRDSREAMSALIDAGYCHALLAGNALATHDLEAARFRTALGQDIYSREQAAGGHCNHLDIINLVRRSGSIPAAIRELGINDGIMAACERHGVPWVLAGSIRDDGPLPGVISDACQAQDAMRRHTRRATTVIALASQLHSIAVGNMLPGYQAADDGTVRPVFFYVVDMSEFCADKLANRGSLQATYILTNVQDFMVNLRHTLIDTGVTP